MRLPRIYTARRVNKIMDRAWWSGVHAGTAGEECPRPSRHPLDPARRRQVKHGYIVGMRAIHDLTKKVNDLATPSEESDHGA